MRRWGGACTLSAVPPKPLGEAVLLLGLGVGVRFRCQVAASLVVNGVFTCRRKVACRGRRGRPRRRGGRGKNVWAISEV